MKSNAYLKMLAFGFLLVAGGIGLTVTGITFSDAKHGYQKMNAEKLRIAGPVFLGTGGFLMIIAIIMLLKKNKCTESSDRYRGQLRYPFVQTNTATNITNYFTEETTFTTRYCQTAYPEPHQQEEGYTQQHQGEYSQQQQQRGCTPQLVSDCVIQQGIQSVYSQGRGSSKKIKAKSILDF